MKKRTKILLVISVILFIDLLAILKIFQLWQLPLENLPDRDTPIKYRGDNINLTIRNIDGPGYKGKVMVVSGNTKGKIKVVVAEGGPGNTERTSSMARRTGAIAAVNGGGFYNQPVQGKTLYTPVFVTIRGGEVIHNENPVRPMLAVGIDKNGRLVHSSKGARDLLKRGVLEAVSFKPALVINGRPVNHPPEGEPAPRTAIGQGQNGDFMFVVIDGRQPEWSSGVSLYQLAKIMQSLGAYNAYNLDGGGSSTMVFKGRVINRPSDFTGERPVATVWCIYDD